MLIRTGFLGVFLIVASVACGAEKIAPHDIEPAPIVAVVPATATPEVIDAGSPSAIATTEAQPARHHDLTTLEENVAEIMNGWTKKSSCDAFDYFPHGGYKNFWCHRPEILTQGFLESRSHTRVFGSGPHANGFKADSKNDFGHYDPAFVRWLADDVAPNGRDSEFRRATQAMFDESMKPLAKIFYWTRQKTIAHSACFQHEKDAYSKAVARKSLPDGYQERWFFFMNPYFCSRAMRGQNDDQFYYDNAFDAGFDGNVAKTAMGFWIRRSIDGTLDEFSRALDKLVAAYMPELSPLAREVSAQKHFPEPAAIENAWSAVERSTGTCKEPSRPATVVRAEIEIDPSGNMASVKIDARSPHGRNPTATEITCMTTILRAMTVPAFDGERLRFDRTFTLR